MRLTTASTNSECGAPVSLLTQTSDGDSTGELLQCAVDHSTSFFWRFGVAVGIVCSIVCIAHMSTQSVLPVNFHPAVDESHVSWFAGHPVKKRGKGMTGEFRQRQMWTPEFPKPFNRFMNDLLNLLPTDYDMRDYIRDEIAIWDKTPVASGKDGSTAKEVLAAAHNKGLWMPPGKRFLSSRPTSKTISWCEEKLDVPKNDRPPLTKMKGRREAAVQLFYNNILRKIFSSPLVKHIRVQVADTSRVTAPGLQGKRPDLMLISACGEYQVKSDLLLLSMCWNLGPIDQRSIRIASLAHYCHCRDASSLACMHLQLLVISEHAHSAWMQVGFAEVKALAEDAAKQGGFNQLQERVEPVFEKYGSLEIIPTGSFSQNSAQILHWPRGFSKLPLSSGQHVLKLDRDNVGLQSLAAWLLNTGVPI